MVAVIGHIFFAFGTENKWPLTALDRVTLYKGSIYREFHLSYLRVATLDRVTLYPGGR